MTKSEPIFDKAESTTEILKQTKVFLILFVSCYVVLLYGCATPPIRSLTEAIYKNDFKGVNSAIAAGANVNDKLYRHTYTALMYSAMDCNPDVVEFLLNSGADVNTKDENRLTALMTAVTRRPSGRPCERRPEIVESLINRGADLNARDNHGRTALMHAALHATEELPEVVKLLIVLLNRGADPNARDIDDRTALMYAADKYYAAQRKLSEVVKFLTILIDRGADPNAKDRQGYTPLFYAAKSRRSDLVKLLHDKGAEYPEPPVLLLGTGGGNLTVVAEGEGTLVSWGKGRESIAIKAGSHMLQVHYRDILGYAPGINVAGNIALNFDAKKRGIYVVRWERGAFETKWRTWVDRYEPSE